MSFFEAAHAVDPGVLNKMTFGTFGGGDFVVSRADVVTRAAAVAGARPLRAALAEYLVLHGADAPPPFFDFGAALVAAGAPREAVFGPAASAAARDAFIALRLAVVLPAAAPFGTVRVDADKCTLCMSCVGACPAGALQDNQSAPQLRFVEGNCVQCGLCARTCPEQAITLAPRLLLTPERKRPRVVNEAQPFACIRCGKPFGVKSSVERVAAKLEGRHWMFKDSKMRLDVIKMCADCRVNAMAEENFDPFGAPKRPAARTTDDYLREREQEQKGE